MDNIGYTTAAYAASLTLIAVYAWHLWRRLRRARHQQRTGGGSDAGGRSR
ncbi:MAG TPA: hypothetical protein VH833_07905 [Gemmatimonadales bacterium]|jgi:hypothetical protein